MIYTNCIKFSFIICVFVASCLNAHYFRSERNFFLATALFFTLIADFFLVLTDMYEIGVFVFCFAHIFYILRNLGAKTLKFCVLVLVLPIFFLNFGVLVIFAIIYMQLFVLNFATAIIAIKKGLYSRLNSFFLVFGLVLFAVCDILVVLYNQGQTGVYNAIWLFYAPAKIFIVISGIKA